jgi:tetratricopeptide (TPR) repeat protein
MDPNFVTFFTVLSAFITIVVGLVQIIGLIRKRITEHHEKPADLGRQTSQLPSTSASADAQAGDVISTEGIADKAQELIANHEKREPPLIVNLPPPGLTPIFKDRVHEMDELRNYLSECDAGLVSVVGRAGVGKTALVCHVLAAIEGGTPEIPGNDRKLAVDGILYLGAKTTGLGLERIYTDAGRMLRETVVSDLATLWASRRASLTAKVEFLLERLQNGSYLILLDDLDSELTEDGEIAEDGLRLFVERSQTVSTGVRLITTSRRDVRIPDTALRSIRRIILREGLPEADAVDLLRDMDPQGTRGLRDAPESDLYHAAQLTEGIPRALEILAGILDRDATVNLSRFLVDEDLFGQHVVEHLVVEGYRRLEEGERRVMEALAVFDRPVEEKSITYLLQPWYPHVDVPTHLHNMVRSYFVNANRASGEYSLHPLDREHAYHQLPDRREPDAYNQRNLELRAADFYTSVRKPENEWKSLDDLAPQLAEFEHRVRAEDFEGAFRVAGTIDSNYLFLWGYYPRLIGMREMLVGQMTDPELEADNQERLGNAYYCLQQVDQAIQLLEDALAIAREIGDRYREERCLGFLGWFYHSQGHLNRAVELYKEALAIAREIGDLPGKMRHLSTLGSVYRGQGHLEQAISCYEAAIAVVQATGDRRWEGIIVSRLGRANLALGNTQQAMALFDEALEIARELGDRRMEGIQLDVLGWANQNRGRVEQAISNHSDALTIARKIGNKMGESYALAGLGKAMLAVNDISEAQRRCTEALALDASEIGPPETGYQAALGLGLALLYQKDPSACETFADAATRCRAILDETPRLYAPRFVLATSLIGEAACDPRWMDEGERAALFAPALTEYGHALENCSAPGVVSDALHDLELIQAAGVQGLQPVFELLERAVAEPQSGQQRRNQCLD